MKLDLKTADAINDLMRMPQFEVFCGWLDALNTAFTESAIAGIEGEPPEVLRGRAQAMKIIKQEMAKAPSVATRIQQIKVAPGV